MTTRTAPARQAAGSRPAQAAWRAHMADRHPWGPCCDDAASDAEREDARRYRRWPDNPRAWDGWAR